jgi:hypothetical protein
MVISPGPGFKNVLNESRLIAMGGNTFNADTFKPSANHKLITMTATMINIKTQEVPDRLNFTSESPVDLTALLRTKVISKLLIVDEPHVAIHF